MAGPPVFIGGFRSGTTLLINLLGMHPGITPWFETKELCEATRWQRVLRDPSQAGFETAYCPPDMKDGFTADTVLARMRWHVQYTFERISGARQSGKAGHERYPLGNDHVLYSPREAEAALQQWRQDVGESDDPQQVAAATGTLILTLADQQQKLHGGDIWINKTPESSRFGDELRGALGPCRIIYLIRDGLHVVASGNRLGWGSIDALAFNWKGLLERTRACMQAYPHDYLELRYEQLIAEPVATLDKVLAFCGQDTAAAAIIDEFQLRFGTGAFDVARLGGRHGLSAAQVGTFNSLAGDMQAALGYPPV